MVDKYTYTRSGWVDDGSKQRHCQDQRPPDGVNRCAATRDAAEDTAQHGDEHQPGTPVGDGGHAIQTARYGGDGHVVKEGPLWTHQSPPPRGIFSYLLAWN